MPIRTDQQNNSLDQVLDLSQICTASKSVTNTIIAGSGAPVTFKTWRGKVYVVEIEKNKFTKWTILFELILV